MTSHALSPSCVVLGITLVLGVSSTVCAAERAAWAEVRTTVQQSKQGEKCTGQRSAEQTARLDTLGREIFEPPVPGLGLESRIVAQGDLIERFGRPLEVSTVKAPGYDPAPNDPDYDWLTWKYEGLVILMVARPTDREESADRKFLVETIELEESRYSLRHGFRVGMPHSEVLELFGCSLSDFATLTNYQSEKPVYQIAIHWDANGRVKRVKWTWYWH